MVIVIIIIVDGGVVFVDEYVIIFIFIEFGFGIGNFIIECWVKCNLMIGIKVILDFRFVVIEVVFYFYIDGGNVRYYNNGSNVIVGIIVLILGIWYYIVFFKDGSNIRLFVNGI